MALTQTLPTDRNNNLYYGPKTYAQAVEMIEEQDDDQQQATARKVADMLENAGYKAVAQRIRKQYC